MENNQISVKRKDIPMFEFIKKLFSQSSETQHHSSCRLSDEDRDYYRGSADRSDARAKALNIDPPRIGRKTYDERRSETSSMSTSQLLALRSERFAQGKQVGVIDRVLSEKD